MWLPVDVQEVQALIEAAERGRQAGGLRRSSARLEAALGHLRAAVESEKQLIADARARGKRV